MASYRTRTSHPVATPMNRSSLAGLSLLLIALPPLVLASIEEPAVEPSVVHAFRGAVYDVPGQFESDDYVMHEINAVRLLQQATFGPTVDSIHELRTMGRQRWLNDQFNKPMGPSHWSAMTRHDWDSALNASEFYGAMDGKEVIVNHAWQTFIESEDQLRERIVAALLEIFVITARVDAIGIKSNQHAAAAFYDLLESHAFGNYRDLLMGVSRSPAMAHYLSFYGSKKAVYVNGMAVTLPDENYAREILQLFSIGLYELNIDGTHRLNNGSPIDSYTQNDIMNLARVFTGWVHNARNRYWWDRYRKPMIPYGPEHSPEPKQFLGTTIAAGTDALSSLNQAIDTIFNHPNVGPFIGRQLIQRLVSSNPSPAYVARVAHAFNNNGRGIRGDMKAVIEAILLDPEAIARSASNAGTSVVRGKLREPMLRLTAVARLLKLKPRAPGTYPIANLMDTSYGLGQSPFKSPSVFNFFRPGYTPPGSMLAENALVAPEFQIVTGSAIPGSINFMNDFISTRHRLFTSDDSQLRALASDAEQLVDYLNLVLTARRLSNGDRDDVIELVNSIPANTRRHRVNAALQAITASPAFFVQKP